MSACGHDPNCSGAGWAHDEQVTPEQRAGLGLPEEGEFSMAHSKRLMRAYRKGWGDGFSAGLEQGIGLTKVTVGTQATDAEQ